MDILYVSFLRRYMLLVKRIIAHHHSHKMINSAEIELEDFIPVLKIADFLIIHHLISFLVRLIRRTRNTYLISLLIRHNHLLKQEFKDALKEAIKGADESGMTYFQD